MRLRIWLVALACVVLAGEARAWKGALGKGVIAIATVAELAEKGDPVTITGRVVWEQDKLIFRLKDDSGEMLVRIPESVRRTSGTPRRGDEVICGGKYTRAYLDDTVWGVHCEQLEIRPRAGMRPETPPAAAD